MGDQTRLPSGALSATAPVGHWSHDESLTDWTEFLDGPPSLRGRRAQNAAIADTQEQLRWESMESQMGKQGPPRQVVSWGGFFCKLIALLFKLILNIIFKRFIFLVQALIRILFITALVASILWFLHEEYTSFKQAFFAVPGRVLSGLYRVTVGIAAYSYCHLPYSPQWGCSGPLLPLDKVIGGMIVQVGDARDIFEMFNALGTTGTYSLGDNHLQFFTF
jgi:hypothetical protein